MTISAKSPSGGGREGPPCPNILSPRQALGGAKNTPLPLPLLPSQPAHTVTYSHKQSGAFIITVILMTVNHSRRSNAWHGNQRTSLTPSWYQQSMNWFCCVKFEFSARTRRHLGRSSSLSPASDGRRRRERFVVYGPQAVLLHLSCIAITLEILTACNTVVGVMLEFIAMRLCQWSGSATALSAPSIRYHSSSPCRNAHCSVVGYCISLPGQHYHQYYAPHSTSLQCPVVHRRAVKKCDCNESAGRYGTAGCGTTQNRYSLSIVSAVLTNYFCHRALEPLLARRSHCEEGGDDRGGVF